MFTKKTIFLFLWVLLIFTKCMNTKNIFFSSIFVKEYEPFVILTFHEEVNSVLILLQEMNLKYEIVQPEEPFTNNSFLVITLGENFPIDKFKEILTFIRNYYPELRYIQLLKYNPNIPERNLYHLYIANSTDIAIKNNLKAWSNSDFNVILQLQKKEEIHNFIINKNQGSSNSIPTGQ